MTNQMTAMVQSGGDKPTLIKTTIPRPAPERHQMLMKVSHAAQNPTDVFALDGKRFDEGAVLGCDFVGTVEEVGADVAHAKKGDVIAGLVRGGETKGIGAYSEYTLADDRISFQVPSSISYAEAATVPLAATTAWLAFFSKDCLAIDRRDCAGVTALVWGGSSSVGLYAVQLGRLYNMNIITTCSPKNSDLVKERGATHVFDHSDPDVIEKIRNVEPNLAYVFDTIGNSASSLLASKAINEKGGALCTVRPGKAYTEGVDEYIKITDVMVWTALRKEIRYGEFVWPVNKADQDLAAELFDSLPKWLGDGKVKPNAVKVKKGLGAVPEGFQEYRDKLVSAYKIVYEL